jgi:hypothetical protein
MLIQDMNHIEAAQTEIIGGNAAAKRISFITSNTFNTNVRGRVDFDSDIASYGTAADAIGGPDFIAFAKADGSSFTGPGVASAVATGVSSLKRRH